MLTLIIQGDEVYDEEKEEFSTIGDFTLELEHSLVSLSKWESKFEKPFLVKGDKTTEEVMGYVQAMTLTPNVPPEVWRRFNDSHMDQVNKYIDAKMSATWFSERTKGSSSREVTTSELIYYWMISLNIPMECQHWHLNRLFTLIKVCNQKNAPQKKMSARELAARNRQLNAERKAAMGTRG